MSEMNEEAARVKAAYARRTVNDVRYGPSSWAHVRMIAEVESLFRTALAEYVPSPLSEATFFEVGCGTGAWLARAVKWGFRPESVAGIELLPERVTAARAALPNAIRVLEGSATQIPFAPASFDVVLQATVFSSIHSSTIERDIAAEMRRILRPNGVILWYDMRVRNPWNPDVHPLRDSRIRELFADCSVALTSATLVPPLARALSRVPMLASALWRIPLLRTHYVAVIRPHG